jgi:hypothetical protein
MRVGSGKPWHWGVLLRVQEVTGSIPVAALCFCHFYSRFRKLDARTCLGTGNWKLTHDARLASPLVV